MQFKFGKLKPLEINCVPTRMFTLLFSISFKRLMVSFFLLRKSLDKIFITLSGKICLNSAKIFSTPGPYI